MLVLCFCLVDYQWSGAGWLTRWREVLEKPQKFDLYPGAGYLVVKVILGDIVIHRYLLEPLRRLDEAPFVLVWSILGQCHYQGRDGQGYAHVRVVHQRNHPLGPFLLHDVGILSIQPQQRQGCLLLDKCLGYTTLTLVLMGRV